ncbi:MAG TPA: DUF2203 family protein [Candidatus Sulfotelmatobacter sp.]|nr:DUF2203 family protein [Candidatus Sulfotelmatobacter sp.]
MSERTFTLEEAQSLLPVLESLLRTAIAAKKLMEEVEAEQQALGHRIFLNGGHVCGRGPAGAAQGRAGQG